MLHILEMISIQTSIARTSFAGLFANTLAGRGQAAIPFLVQEVLLVAGLMASFSLFLGVKKETRKQARRNEEVSREIEELLPKVRAMTMLSESDERSTKAATILSERPPVRTGFNLRDRTQAIRLLRRGEDVAHISAALGVPRGEVELLIRVQQLAATRPVKPS